MFTVADIRLAHSKVKSGADFPAYINEIKGMGVTYYESFVSDGHTDYFGLGDYKTSSPGKYSALFVSEILHSDQFRKDLKAHQEGQTDYLTFCGKAAKSGIEKWAVCMEKMTCTYFDKSGGMVLVEEIPA